MEFKFLQFPGLLFQRAEEEYLSEREHVELAIRAFSGLLDALEYIKPYLEQYEVVPSRFQLEGSILEFRMKRKRTPLKFYESLRPALTELLAYRYIDKAWYDITIEKISRLLSEGVPIDMIPSKIISEIPNIPKIIVETIKDEIPSDIDSTLYLKSIGGWPQVYELLKRLEKEKEYSPKYKAEISIHDRISEIASEKTKPHPLWIKLEAEA